jgi:hypothetical protein
MSSKTPTRAVTPRRGSKLTIGFGLVNVEVKYASLIPSSVGRTAARCLFQLRGREYHQNGLQKLAFKLHSGPGDQGEQVLTIMLPEED